MTPWPPQVVVITVDGLERIGWGGSARQGFLDCEAAGTDLYQWEKAPLPGGDGVEIGRDAMVLRRQSREGSERSLEE